MAKNETDCSSSDSDDEGLVAFAFDKSSIFPNERHTCLMAKEKNVRTRDTPKYTSSSDEESSDDEVEYSDLFKGLDIFFMRNMINLLMFKNLLLLKLRKMNYCPISYLLAMILFPILRI